MASMLIPHMSARKLTDTREAQVRCSIERRLRDSVEALYAKRAELLC